MSDILDKIDAAVGCHQCHGPLGASPSDDFCGEDCQTAWRESRSGPLSSEALDVMTVEDRMLLMTWTPLERVCGWTIEREFDDLTENGWDFRRQVRAVHCFVNTGDADRKIPYAVMQAASPVALTGDDEAKSRTLAAALNAAAERVREEHGLDNPPSNGVGLFQVMSQPYSIQVETEHGWRPIGISGWRS